MTLRPVRGAPIINVTFISHGLECLGHVSWCSLDVPVPLTIFKAQSPLLSRRRARQSAFLLHSSDAKAALSVSQPRVRPGASANMSAVLAVQLQSSCSSGCQETTAVQCLMPAAFSPGLETAGLGIAEVACVVLSRGLGNAESV